MEEEEKGGVMITEATSVEWGPLSKTLVVESVQDGVMLATPDGRGKLYSPFTITLLRMSCGTAILPPLEMTLTAKGTLRISLPLHTRVRVVKEKEKAVILLP